MVNQTIQAAYNAGFRGDSLIIAVAIAGAESAYNPAAVGDIEIGLDSAKWGSSYGLWQIRSLEQDYLHMEPVRNAALLPDPNFNAKAAYQISKRGTDWRPWSTYTNNAYLQFMERARREVNEFLKSPAPVIAEVKKKPCQHW